MDTAEEAYKSPAAVKNIFQGVSNLKTVTESPYLKR